MGASGSKTPRATTKEGRQAGAMFDEVELHVISLTYKDLAGLSKGDKRGEAIDKATFLQNFPVPGLVGDRLFHALDSNNTGRISFDDFVVGLAVCCRGTLEEKMRFIFGVYDMDGDGYISRDELLLMLNQVPRTLLSIGGGGNDSRNTGTGGGNVLNGVRAGVDQSSPRIDWETLALGTTNRAGDARGSPPAATSRGSVGGNPETRFFKGEEGGGQHSHNGGSGHHRPPPPPPSSSASSNPSGRGRLRSVERKKSKDGGSSWTVGSTSAWTNESIADQALGEFGGGDGKPLTFEQFQRWAQQTPAIQALLQGAFPSDAHFSLATSPRARKVSCESLSSFDSPRRPSTSLKFGTPTRASGAAATAVAAVAAWSASASASRPQSRRGTPMRQGSFGGVDTSRPNSTTRAGSGSVFFSGNEVTSGGSHSTAGTPGTVATAPTSARTPSRMISRNTSYDNLLRTPLVGQGVVGQAMSSPVPRGLPASGRLAFPEDTRRDISAMTGAGVGGSGAAGKGTWKWGAHDGVPKTPRTGSYSKAGSGGWTSDGDRALKRPGICSTPSGSRSGILMDREVDATKMPLTTGRMRRKSSPGGPCPSSLMEGSSPALTVEPSPASSSYAYQGPHKRGGAGSSSSSFTLADDDASRLSPRPPSIDYPPATGGGASGSVGGGGRGDRGTSLLRTPSNVNADREARTPSSGAALEVTRKARKLAMMAQAAEEAERSGTGRPTSCRDLLALANAVAASENPTSSQAHPRRGKLLRLLSQDAVIDYRNGIAPARRKLMRLGSHETLPEENERDGFGAPKRNKRLSLRRTNSLSAAEHARRKSGPLVHGGILPSRRERDHHDTSDSKGVSSSSGGSSEQAPLASSQATLGPRAPAGSPPGRTEQAEKEVDKSSLRLSAARAVALGATLARDPSGEKNANGVNSPSSGGDGVRATDDSGVAGEHSSGGATSVSASSVTPRGSRHLTKKSAPPRPGRPSLELSVEPSAPPAAAAGSASASSSAASVSTDYSLGAPLSKVSPLLAANGGAFFGNGGMEGGGAGSGGDESGHVGCDMAAVQSTVGAEAVVRDCLYNSHGLVALDGFLWKPGSIRLIRRWMMLVDNTLYYFVRPGDRKPRGVISMPGCIAEPVLDDEEIVCNESSSRKDNRKSRVPNGFFGLRLFRPNNHGKDSVSRLLLAKSAQERDEWVAELRVASRVVPLEDSFEIKSLLRKGAFASVHRCVRKDSGEEFAVKVIDKTSLSSHEKFLLRGEIGALKLVAHPNVVRLEAVHEDPRSISIVMTLCRGGDLWDKVRSQPSRCLTTNQARTVMRPLCEAVAYLHTLGILHRDIKPENILLIDNGSGNLSGVTLSDFGFSHQVSPKSRLACGKQLMGTPSYMAPESILHGMYGKEVDWFSCGCVLYMMLMGRAPFAGNNPSEIFRNTCHGRLGLGRGGASMWDKLPSAARELIVGLMQLDHNLRYTGEQAMNHRWLAESSDEEDGEEEAEQEPGEALREAARSRQPEKQHQKHQMQQSYQQQQHHQRQRQQQASGETAESRESKAKTPSGSRRREGEKGGTSSSTSHGRRGSRGSSESRKGVGSGDGDGGGGGGGGGGTATSRNGKLQGSRVRSAGANSTSSTIE